MVIPPCALFPLWPRALAPPFAAPAAMALLDSVAVFKSRVTEIGLASCWPKFEEKMWDTHASFAFCVSRPPGQTEDDEFHNKVVEPIAGPGSNLSSRLRRLHYESFSFWGAEQKRKVERTGDEAPIVLPLEERLARRAKCQLEIGDALPIADELEPAQCTVDLACALLVANIPSRIDLSDCPTRAAERELGAKAARKKFQRPGPDGVVRESSEKETPRALLDTSLQLSQAFQRRGISLHEGKVMSFKEHERIRRRLMKAYTKVPSDSLYQSPSWPRIEEADCKIFELLEELSYETGIRPRGDGTLPLDALVKTVLGHVDVGLLLQPLPRAGGGGSRRPSGLRDAAPAVADDGGDAAAQRGVRKAPGTGTSKGALKRRRLTQVLTDLKRQVGQRQAPAPVAPAAWVPPPPAGPPPGGGKGKGKGPAMPAALFGKAATSATGERMCYGYNLGQCTAAAPGQNCPRGKHGCMEPSAANGAACGAAHPCTAHV